MNLFAVRFQRRKTSVTTRDGNITLVTLKRSKTGYDLSQVTQMPINGKKAPSSWIRKLIKIPVTDIAMPPSVFMKFSELPGMSEGEALATLRLVEKDFAPFDLAEAEMDVWILTNGAPPGRMRSLMAAMPKDEVRRRRERLAGMGLALSGVTVIPAAIGALLRNSVTIPKDGLALFVHMEEGSAGVHVFDRCEPVFSREIPVMAVSPAVKVGYGATEYDGEPRRGFTTEVARSLDFFTRSSRGAAPACGYIIGHGCDTRMEKELEEALGIKFRRYDPLDDFVSVAAVAPKPDGAAIALNIGMAIDGGGKINTAGAGMTANPLLKKAVAALMAVALITAVCAYATHRAFTDLGGKIDGLRATVSAMETQKAEHEKYTARILKLTGENGSLEKRIAAYSWLTTEHDWPEALRNLAVATPGNLMLSSVSYDETRTATGKNFTIKGVAKGAEAEKLRGIMELTKSLSATAFFTFVSLDKTYPADDDSGFTMFEISCEIVLG